VGYFENVVLNVHAGVGELVVVVVVVVLVLVEEAALAKAMLFTALRAMKFEPTCNVGPLAPLLTPDTTPVMTFPLESAPVTVLPRREAASLNCELVETDCSCSTCESWAI